MQDLDLLEKLKALLKQKRSRKFYSEKLNISEGEVSKLMGEIKSTNFVQVGECSNPTWTVTASVGDASTYNWDYSEDFEKGEIDMSVTSDNALTIDELIRFHKIDSDKYKVSNYWTIFKNGKFRSSLHATLKKSEDYSSEDFAKFLSTYTPILPKHSCKCKPSNREVVDVELSIADFHLAKKTISGDNKIESRKDVFMKAVDYMLSAVSHFNIGKIVFPVSNDFFHTDNYQNSTTNGTPQDTITSFDHEYEEGFDLLVTVIDLLSEIAIQVEVILVQGNHDRTKSFYLAHALEVYFTNYKNVSFQRHHSITKSTILGNTFIGYHHGNCKIDELPLLFATGNDSFNFGLCKYREVHTGDKHHYMAKEIKGVRIQQMPSLSGTDRWHEDNNFVNSIRAGLILIYHPENGKIGEFEYRL